MDAEILKTVGQVAGVGGLALGVFLLLFRDIIRKQIFPMLGKVHAYRLLRLSAVLVFSVALAGISAYVYVETNVPPSGPQTITTHGDGSPVSSNTNGDVEQIINSPPVPPAPAPKP